MPVVTGKDTLSWGTDIDTSGLMSGSQRAKGILKGLTNNITALDVFAGLSISAALAFKSILKETAEFSSDFEDGMKKVQTISASVQENFDGISMAIIDMSTRVPVDILNLTEALYQLESAGFAASDSMVMLETAAKAAVAGGISTETAIKGINTVLNAWNLTAADADKVAETFFATIKLGVTEFDQLANNISTVAPFASAMGISFEEIGGAVATLTKGGATTSAAFTQLRAAIVGLNKELPDGWNNMMTFQEALEEIAKQADGSTKELRNLLPEIEAQTAALGLTGENADKANAAILEVITSTGAFKKAFVIMNDTTTNQVKLMGNNIRRLLKPLGDDINSWAKGMVKDLNTIFEFLGDRRFDAARKRLETLATPPEIDMRVGNVLPGFAFDSSREGAVEAEKKTYLRALKDLGIATKDYEQDLDKLYDANTKMAEQQKLYNKIIERTTEDLDKLNVAQSELNDESDSADGGAVPADPFATEMKKIFESSGRSVLDITKKDILRRIYEKEAEAILEATKTFNQQRIELDEKYSREREIVIQETYGNERDTRLAILRKSYEEELAFVDREEEKFLGIEKNAQAERLGINEDTLDKIFAAIKGMNLKQLKEHKKYLKELWTQEKGNAELRKALLGEIAEVSDEIYERQFENISELEDSLHSLSELFEGVNDDVSNKAKAVADVLGSATNLAGAVASEDVGKSITSLIGLAVSLKDAVSAFSDGGRKDVSLDTGLMHSYLQKMIDSSIGETTIERLTDYSWRLRKKMDDVNGMVANEVEGHRGLVAAFVGVAEDVVLPDRPSRSYYDSLSEYVSALSAWKTETNKILDDAGDITQVTEEEIALFDDLVDKLNEVELALKHALTGTTPEGIADTISTGLIEGFETARSLFDTFEATFAQVIKNALMENFKNKVLSDALLGWYDDFANASERGMEGPEFDRLKEGFRGLINDAQDDFIILKEFLEEFDLDPFIQEQAESAIEESKKSPLVSALRGMSENTAGLLAGQFNAIRSNTITIKDAVVSMKDRRLEEWPVLTGHLENLGDIRSYLYSVQETSQDILIYTTQIANNTEYGDRTVAWLLNEINDKTVDQNVPQGVHISRALG